MEISCSENIPADPRKAIEKLRQGLEIAKQLRILICKSSSGENEKSMDSSPIDLLESISNSFNYAVSVFNNVEIGEFNRSSASMTGLKSEDSEGSSKSTARVKNRRVCYERRKAEDTWSTLNWAADGYAWRKYGQKVILNCQYPREYYRCTHNSEGCSAKKIVQQIRDDPPLHRTTYHGNHTCQDLGKPSDQMILDDYYGADTADSPVLLSFDNSKPQNKTIFNHLFCSSSLSLMQDHNNVAHDYHVVDYDLTQNKPSSSDYVFSPDELTAFGSSYDNADIINHNFDMGSTDQFEDDLLKQYGF